MMPPLPQQPPQAGPAIPPTPAAPPVPPSAGVGVSPAPPLLPGPGTSPSMPTGVPAQPQKPPMPAGPLPPIQRQAPVQEPQDPDKIVNPFERVAALIVNQAQDLAQRLSDNLSEAPANSKELTPEEIKAMWYYSPAGTPPEADAKFWQVHDQVLAQTGDHAQAEDQAMKAAYPYRPILAQQGNANAERQVQIAEAIRKQVDGEHAPDSSQVGLDNALHSTQVRQAGGNV